jgi:hypothetical protein
MRAKMQYGKVGTCHTNGLKTPAVWSRPAFPIGIRVPPTVDSLMIKDHKSRASDANLP